MCLYLLELADTRMEQVNTEHELQDQYADRVDISVTISLQYSVRHAYHPITALLPLLNRQVFQLHCELIAPQRVYLAEVYVFSLTIGCFIISCVVFLIRFRCGRFWTTYLANLNLKKQCLNAQVPDCKTSGVKVSQSLE